jgi:FKBP-type peptidyl-prolyl cis-trans isomerase
MKILKKCFLLGVLPTLAFSLTSCTMCSKDEKAASETASSESSPKVDELITENLKESSGSVVAQSGKKVTVHYTGRLMNGKVFDSSEQRQAPFSFILGAGQVIPGWEKGITGMKIGERRKLTIPPNLAYGPKAIGDVIPANSTLQFEVELLNVE